MSYKREFKEHFKSIIDYVEYNKVKSDSILKVFDKSGRILRLIDHENIAYYEYSIWKPFPVVRVAYMDLASPCEITIFTFDSLGRSVQYENSSGSCAHYLYLSEHSHTIAAKLICYKNKVIQIHINEKLTVAEDKEVMNYLIPIYLQERGLICTDDGVKNNITRCKIIISE